MLKVFVPGLAMSVAACLAGCFNNGHLNREFIPGKGWVPVD